MKKIYLVLTGNEYGYDINDNDDLPLLSRNAATIRFNHFLEEYGCAVMYRIEIDKLIKVKETSNLH